MSAVFDSHINSASPVSPGTLTLQVAALYADPAWAEKAGQIYPELLSKAGAVCEVNCTWWCFDHLLEPLEFQKAVLAGSRADVLAVAAQASVEIPALVSGWLDLCTGTPARSDRILVALLGRAPSSPPGIVFALDAALQAIASRAGLRYLPCWLEPPGAMASAGLETEKKPPASHTSLLPEDFFRASDVPDWGINE